MPGPNTWLVGESSSVRMAMASRPPVKRKPSTPITYCMPDHLVVGGVAEVAGPAGRLVVGPGLHAHDLGQRVVEGPDAQQPAQHAGQQAGGDRHGVDPGRLDVVVAAGHPVAEPVAEQVAAHGQDGGRAQVLAQPARPGRQALEPAQDGRGRVGVDDFGVALGGKGHRWTVNFLVIAAVSRLSGGGAVDLGVAVRVHVVGVVAAVGTVGVGYVGQANGGSSLVLAAVSFSVLVAQDSKSSLDTTLP